jgi:hypothetical protein
MESLDKYMGEAMQRRFQYGTFDCFLFAAGAVLATTGKDHMADLRGYGDKTSAEILLRERFGTLNLKAVFLETAHKAHARRLFDRHTAEDGDIALVQWPKVALKSSEIDQSIGLGVYWQWRVFCCASTGVMQVPNVPSRVLEFWRF